MMNKYRNWRLRFVSEPGSEQGGSGEGGAPAPTPTPTPPPTPVPTPPATPTPQSTGPETFSREYVHELREEAKANRIQSSQHEERANTLEQELAKAQAEREQYQTQLEELQKTQAVSQVSTGLADPTLLLDSTKFREHIAEVNLSDTEALKAKVEEFVEQNPAYSARSPLPGTSGGLPGGKNTQSGPITLEGAIGSSLVQ